MSDKLEHSSWAISDEHRVDIFVGRGTRKLLPGLIESLGTTYSLVALVADSGLPEHFRRDAEEALRSTGRLVARVLTGGEQAKSLDTVRGLWEWLLGSGADRDSLLIAYGGGAVSDAAGFAAATYMRGIDWAVIPTTLLSMVDASVGGKTAVNLGAKNIIGAFHHPRLVVIDTEHLETLGKRDYVAGLAEVVKHALLEGRWFLEWLLSHREEILARRHNALAKMIRLSLDTKMRIVSRDYRERRGDRALLNLGHTVAHALEKATGYSLRHGEAVAIGLVVESYLAHRVTGLPLDEVEEIKNALASLGLPTRPPDGLEPSKVLRLVRLDKKRKGDKILLPLLERIGKPVLIELELGEAIAMLREAWGEASHDD